jgi:hypothetical protein
MAVLPGLDYLVWFPDGCTDPAYRIFNRYPADGRSHEGAHKAEGCVLFVTPPMPLGTTTG